MVSMLVISQDLSNFWAQWGPLGAIVVAQTTALAVVGKWFIARADRQDSAWVQSVKEGAEINARTVAVLDKLTNKVGEIDGELAKAVTSTTAAHAHTHKMLEAVSATLERQGSKVSRG